MTYNNVGTCLSKFKVISEITPNPTVYLIPENFRSTISGGSISENPAHSIAISGYPTISYITDYYNAWLAQNSGIIEVQMRQEQYNYETNVTVAQAKNTMGAIQNSISAVGNSAGQMATGNIRGRNYKRCYRWNASWNRPLYK